MSSNPVAFTWTSDMAPVLSKEFFDIQASYRVWIHSETRTWHDNNIQSPSDIWISITKHIQTLRYIHNTKLNISTKARSCTFDPVLNALVFYRCCLTSRVTLRPYSKLIQPYIVLLRHIKNPAILRDLLLQPYLGIL